MKLLTLLLLLGVALAVRPLASTGAARSERSSSSNAGKRPANVSAIRPTIAVGVVGDSAAEFRQTLAPALAEAFGADIVEAPAATLPPLAFDRTRHQWLSTGLLDVLAEKRKSRWERLLGIADVDLYAAGLNFVFGQADPRRGVAVFSVARLRTGTDDPLFWCRLTTEAIHELGHTYGLTHCDLPDCVMWFSRNLADSDRKGTRFCRRHARELDAVLARIRR